MQPIEEILAAAEQVENIESRIVFLQANHRTRDQEIERLRAEQLALHDAMEPLHHRVNMAKAGPAHLRQTLMQVPDVKLGGQ